MKSIIFAFLSIFNIAGTAQAQQGWVPLTSGVTSGLDCISLVGLDTIYIGGELLLRSTDAGASWSRDTNVPVLGSYAYVHFFDANYGILCGTTDRVYRTTNGGLKWDTSKTGTVLTPIGTGRSGGHVSFGSKQNGVIVCNPTVYTVDSGRTWHQSNGGWENCVAFSDSIHAFMMGNAGLPPPNYTPPPAAAFENTSDGGATWHLSYTQPSADGKHSGMPTDVWGIASINPDTIFAVGLQIGRSFDAGAEWDTVAYPGTDEYNGFLAITFPDSRHGTAVGSSGWIIHTTDGGMTWQRQSSTFSGNLGAVAFADSSVGYACGSDGGIIKTTNGGLSWVRLLPGVDSVQGLVYPNPTNNHTSILYSIPIAQHVELAILNLTGTTAETLVSGSLQQGWQTAEVDTSNLPSGTYVYSLTSEKYHATGKIEVIH